MKKKLASSNLWGFILAIVVGLTAFFYETFIGFPAYIDGLPEGSTEGLGIFGVLVLGIYAFIVATVLAISSLVAYIAINKSVSPAKIRGVAIFGIVVLFLLAAGCVFYGILMLSVYIGGWFGKIVYFGVGIAAITLAILNIVRLKKLTKQEE